MHVVAAWSIAARRLAADDSFFPAFTRFRADDDLVSVPPGDGDTSYANSEFCGATSDRRLCPLVLPVQSAAAVGPDRDLSQVGDRRDLLVFVCAGSNPDRFPRGLLVEAQNPGTTVVLRTGLFSGDAFPGVGILRPILPSLLVGRGSLAVLLDHRRHRPGRGRWRKNWPPNQRPSSMGWSRGSPDGAGRRHMAAEQCLRK